MGRSRLTMVAATVTLLALYPLSTVFAGWSWLLSCGLAVLVVAGATAMARGVPRTDLDPGHRGGGRTAGVADPAPRSLVRRRRAARVGDAHAAWAEFLDTLIDLKLSINPAHTPRRIMDRAVTGLAPPARACARELVSAEERARYARRPPPAGNLPATVRVLRRALVRGVSRRRRLAAALLPRSILLRWRYALARLPRQRR